MSHWLVNDEAAAQFISLLKSGGWHDKALKEPKPSVFSMLICRSKSHVSIIFVVLGNN
jgi:hypothetical protein